MLPIDCLHLTRERLGDGPLMRAAVEGSQWQSKAVEGHRRRHQRPSEAISASTCPRSVPGLSACHAEPRHRTFSAAPPAPPAPPASATRPAPSLAIERVLAAAGGGCVREGPFPSCSSSMSSGGSMTDTSCHSEPL